MKRPNRSVEIFSLSALDLFASAMGAFILIAVIMMPDYLNKTKVRAEIDALKDSVSQLQQKNEALQREQREGRTNALLGISTSANSFVFLIDTSGSMGDLPEYGDRLKLITSQAIAGLQPDQTLQIIGFSGESSSANLTPWLSPFSMESMTDQNKRAAGRFVESLAQGFAGLTPTEEALTEALQYDAEAIILVTDGEPNGASSDADFDAFVDRITVANGGKMEIHTVGIGKYATKRLFLDFLNDLADSNNGHFLGF